VKNWKNRGGKILSIQEETRRKEENSGLLILLHTQKGKKGTSSKKRNIWTDRKGHVKEFPSNTMREGERRGENGDVVRRGRKSIRGRSARAIVQKGETKEEKVA